MTITVMADQLGSLDNFTIQEYDPGPPGPGQVRINVKAAGVSFVDTLNAQGKYQNQAPVPFIPGSECSGVIAEIGPGVEKDLTAGQSVIATSWGGLFSRSANVPAKNVYPMPAGMSFETAAAFLVSTSTAWHALADRANLKANESVLVLGAGGATGYAAVQIAKHFGANVIASASTAEKRDLALRAGADAAVDSRSKVWRKDILVANNGAPMNIVFDPVGGCATKPAFRSLAYNGRHLIVGFPGGLTSITTNLPLLKGASLVGVNLQKFGEAEPREAQRNMELLLELGEKKFFHPEVTHTFPLAKFKAAMTLVAEASPAGRVVLTIS